MRYTIRYSGQFKRSYKLCKKRGLDISIRRRINKARKEYAKGDTTTCRTPQEMQQFFDSL